MSDPIEGTSAGPGTERDQILEYLRTNRDRYTPAALREQLLAAGHSPAAIDEAGRLSDAEVQAEVARNSRDIRGIVALIALGAYFAAFAIFALFSNLRSGYGPLALTILAGVLTVAFLISLLVIFLMQRLRMAPRANIRGALLVGLVLPLVLLFVVTGLCAVTTQAFGPACVYGCSPQ
jgi:hypothetical protein